MSDLVGKVERGMRAVARGSHTVENVMAALTPDIATLEAELLEQARIVGAGGERELALMAKVTALEAEVARLREALVFIAEEHDAGRHDGLPEPCPAHDDITMWIAARAALGEQP